MQIKNEISKSEKSVKEKKDSGETEKDKILDVLRERWEFPYTKELDVLEKAKLNKDTKLRATADIKTLKEYYAEKLAYIKKI